MYCVYIIQSERDESFYVGQTNNLDDRLVRHNAGRNKYTKHKTPWTLVHTEFFNTRVEAMHREAQIKSWKSKLAINELISLV